MDHQSGLGRGLASLIPSREPDVQGGEPAASVRVSDIDSNPRQPRQSFEHASLEDLINSIREHGIVQPLVVTPTAGGRFRLIAGERRLRAAKILGLETVPVIVRKASDQEQLELALVENVQRKDLNPIERALGYKSLVDEFNLTQEEIAKKVGQSRPAVANTLRLLTLPEEIKQALREAKLTEGHGKAILSVEGETAQLALARKILLHNLTVREVEAHVRPRRRGVTPQETDPGLSDYQRELEEALGTKVEITRKRKGGKIVIEFYSEEELKGIIRKITRG